MEPHIFCVIGESRYIHGGTEVTLVERTWLLLVASDEDEARRMGEDHFRAEECSFLNEAGETVEVRFYRIVDVQWKDRGAALTVPYEAYTSHVDPEPEDRIL